MVVMSEYKHTPGDWTAWHAPDGTWAIRTVYEDEQGRRTTAWPAVCNAGAQPNEQNARLIAAAPSLLAALTAIADAAPAMQDALWAQVAAAIAKAEGRPA
jgi:hypothetical protein